MKNNNNKIIASISFNKKPCEYVDLRNIQESYQIVDKKIYKVLQCCENFAVTEKLIEESGRYINTHIKECFRYHELECYLYSREKVVKDAIIVIPVYIEKCGERRI